jgi:hypothetical protein
MTVAFNLRHYSSIKAASYQGVMTTHHFANHLITLQEKKSLKQTHTDSFNQKSDTQDWQKVNFHEVAEKQPI